MIVTQRLHIDTQGDGDIKDITRQVEKTVAGTGVTDGLVTVFVAHSTAAVAVTEFEPGLAHDFPATWGRLVPQDMDYRHNHGADDNGHAHVRASMQGPSLVVPLERGRLTLGTWQRVVLLDFDTSPRTRQLVVQVMGE